jgi:hypothetical protein
MANHLHLSSETISTYERKINKLGLSNYRWIGGNEDIPTSNKPIEPGSSSTSGTSSPGSFAAPEGTPKKPESSSVKKGLLADAKPKTTGGFLLAGMIAAACWGATI